MRGADLNHLTIKHQPSQPIEVCIVHGQMTAAICGPPG